MKIWVIERGEYSDYHVVGVFSTKENAELFRSRMKDDYSTPTITEWEMDPGIEHINAGRNLYSVAFTGHELAPTIKIMHAGSADPGEYHGRDWKSNPWHSYYLWSDSADHAIKIASERLYQHLAKEKGLT